MATAALVVGAAVTAAGMQWRASATEAQAIASQARTIKHLQQEVDNLETFLHVHPEWSEVAARVEPSVVTIETDEDLGSGWVAHTDSSGSDIVTNFHIVEAAYTAGKVNVDVHHFDELLQGTITSVDRSDDLAVVHVSEHLPALTASAARPLPGQWVMAVGAPLGLSESLSVGVIAAYRSIEGGDYMQFTAPISPGNSGGPVTDEHGRVVGITTAKVVYRGSEGLGFAVPVQTACLALVVCAQAGNR
jgi:S1-C subfamily serine protease